MANDLNQCNFIGNLGDDPTVRYMPEGGAVANFNIACGWKTKEKSGTEWIRIVVYGRLAEICGEYLRKGSKIFVSGRFKTRKWTDKDNIERYTTEIVCSEMQMLDGRPDGQSNGSHQRAPAQQQPQRQPAPASTGRIPRPTSPAAAAGTDVA